MAGPNERAISSAGCTFRINNKKVGSGQSARFSEAITNQPRFELGDVDAQEHVPTQRVVSLSVGLVRLKRRSLKAQGINPRGGTFDVLNFPEMVAELWDESEDVPIAKVEGVRFANQDISVDVGGIVMVQATFDARRLFDEFDS